MVMLLGACAEQAAVTNAFDGTYRGTTTVSRSVRGAGGPNTITVRGGQVTVDLGRDCRVTGAVAADGQVTGLNYTDPGVCCCAVGSAASASPPSG